MAKSRSRHYDDLFIMSGKVLKKAKARRKKTIKSRARLREKPSSKKLLDKYVSGPLHGYEPRYTHLHTGTAKDLVILVGFPRI